MNDSTMMTFLLISSEHRVFVHTCKLFWHNNLLLLLLLLLTPIRRCKTCGQLYTVHSYFSNIPVPTYTLKALFRQWRAPPVSHWQRSAVNWPTNRPKRTMAHLPEAAHAVDIFLRKNKRAQKKLCKFVPEAFFPIWRHKNNKQQRFLLQFFLPPPTQIWLRLISI